MPPLSIAILVILAKMVKILTACSEELDSAGVRGISLISEARRLFDATGQEREYLDREGNGVPPEHMP